MKTKILSVFLLAAAIFTGCSKDDSSDDNSSAGNLNQTVQQGKWKITLYNDSGTNETYHFTGYEFTFSNGTVTAVKGTTTVTGSFSTGTDDGSLEMILNFGDAEPWEELTDDWDVLEKSTTKIRLQDDSGGGSGTDLLTFEKV